MTYPDWSIVRSVRVNCRDCTAECCKHVAVQIDEPKTWQDYQDLADYLQYANVSVYKDNDGDWIVEFKTRCGQLDENRCMAFKEDKQPVTCREYDVKTCVMNQPGDYHTILLDTPEDVAAYARKKGIRRLIATDRASDCDVFYCNHLSVSIDEPEEWRDFDDIRWYVAHKNVSVYKDNDGDWMVRFDTPLRKPCLRCTEEGWIDEEGDYDIFFSCMEDVDAHIAKLNIRKPLPKLALSSY